MRLKFENHWFSLKPRRARSLGGSQSPRPGLWYRSQRNESNAFIFMQECTSHFLWPIPHFPVLHFCLAITAGCTQVCLQSPSVQLHLVPLAFVLGLFALLWEPAQPFYHMCKSGMRGSNHLCGWDSGDKSSGFSISGRHFQSLLPGPQQDWVPITHSYNQHNNPGLGFSPALFAFSVLHSLESCPQINYHT